ncbi:MAG: vWA domain-containing protein [Gemmataceae bacterium]
MAQLKRVVEPFGEVNVFPVAGGTRVVATILMEPRREGTQTGIALDGSGSMANLYGVQTGGGLLSSIFGGRAQTVNQITPIAQKLCHYLASRLDADGGTTCIYWATGPGGSQVEVIGDLTADQVPQHLFGPPREFGTGTQLLPAVRYFTERFQDAPWGFYVFLTDGELHDLEQVKWYSTQLAREIAAGRRHPVKFVLIGIGPDVNERQMEELDDLETGTAVDLWDHKLAAEMRQVQDIFAEVVDKNARVADRGKILDPQGRAIKDYSDTGLPAYLEFTMPAGAAYFTLEVNGNRIHQGLSDTAQVPPSQLASSGAATAPVAAAIPSAVPAPPPPPAAPTTEDLASQDEDALWKQIDLQRSDAAGVDLEKPQGET